MSDFPISSHYRNNNITQTTVTKKQQQHTIINNYTNKNKRKFKNSVAYCVNLRAIMIKGQLI